MKDLQKYLTKTCAASAAKLKQTSKVEIMKLQTELDDLKVEYEELNQRHEALGDDHGDLQKRHDQLATGIKQLQKELDAKAKRLNILRNSDCAKDEPLPEEEEAPVVDVEQLVKDVEEGLEEPEQEGDGPTKSWGSTRGRFNKGSQMRVENKAFIKN